MLSTEARTREGVVMGTVPYVSPEQARGKPVDKRADIWAFGVLLYEMLAGRQLFAGDTVSDVLAAVLRQEVDWKALPPSAPAQLRRLLGRCLERNPKNRLHDIADARIAIDELQRGAERNEPPPAVARKLAWSRGLVIGAACAGLAIAALAGYWAARQGGGAAPALRFERLTYRFGHFVNARFAPDGQAVFYAAMWEGRPRELAEDVVWGGLGAGRQVAGRDPEQWRRSLARVSARHRALPGAPRDTRLASGLAERRQGCFLRGRQSGVYLRDLSGAAAIRLGDGTPQDLSADGRWALALRGDEIVPLPTGARAPRSRRLPFSELGTARFQPDGERIVLAAREGGGSPRLFVFDPGGRTPTPTSSSSRTSTWSRACGDDREPARGPTPYWRHGPRGAVTTRPRPPGPCPRLPSRP